MERRAIEIRGIVQGVGFRPFVYTLASHLRLGGFVTNTASGVFIEAEGEPDQLERFQQELISSAPALARIESVVARAVLARGEREFRITLSEADGLTTLSVPPDAATCAACVAELFDPLDRRFRYPFINCTACGPRLTIVCGAPYDRERTTMAAFAMCPTCRREYTNPNDRRFHAEANACAACGPRLWAVDGDGNPIRADAIDVAADAIGAGQIVAIKGIGGFHLACDATNAAAVGVLRRRKHRDDKPFAIMLRDVNAAAAVCALTDDERDLLRSSAAPIVLLRRRKGSVPAVAGSVAPDMDRLGVMLPYTPIQHLLFDLVRDRPLVMTSGNRSDEPIATDNDEAIRRLAGIADVFLVHDRAIHVRCDDSVVECGQHAANVVRRSRGYAPASIRLHFDMPEPILAVGGHLKNTFAIARGRHAFLSHYIGDLDDLRAFEAYQRDIALFEALLNAEPSVVAYDAHPDYASTRVALARTARERIAVQHHHAHLAACMAEHGIEETVIGIVWDGAGWAPDGTVWGGEFLVGDRRRADRVAHFRYVPLPGGDRAAREPWRMALAHLLDAGVDPPDGVFDSVSPAVREHVRRMIARRVQTPLTSSVGRLFDAVASIVGLRHTSSFEGQAAMQLQALAERSTTVDAYPFRIVDAEPMVVDTRPLIGVVLEQCRARLNAAAIARQFHSTLAVAAVEVCRQIRLARGLSRVVLTGGVFVNSLLSSDLERRLVCEGFGVYRHRIVPAGDGGLSLGQLAVAAAVMKEGI